MGLYPFPPDAAIVLKGSYVMLIWFSENWINILLVIVIVLITGLLVLSMIRDKKAGKHSCGGNCAGCGACACSACGKCGMMKPAAKSEYLEKARSKIAG